MSQCIFEYCNFNEGYLRIRILSSDETEEKEVEIDLSKYGMANGVIQNIEALAEHIQNQFEFEKFPQILLYLRCEETYKSILSLPSMNRLKALYLYQKEQKVKGAKEGYSSVFNIYKHEFGYIFNTYYMPNDVIDSFKEIAKLLNTKIATIKPYGFYLKNTISREGDYVYFYIRKHACTMVFLAGKEMVSTYDFAFKDEKDIVKYFLLVMSKHEFEFEHKNISHYVINSDIPIELNVL